MVVMLPFPGASAEPANPSRRMTPADNPYLSLVVTARYDDHGGNFMRRMQSFLNAFIEQCRSHRLPAEVIIVEWNPLADRCSLAQALEWPLADAMEWCQVRFIEVPPEIHARYEHAAKIPLYQMIAKNAAIRRARGEWILATNIDIFFNEPMMSFLAQQKLERGKMYRIDRHDADEDIPVWATVTQQLEYCETHLLRIMAREGTFTLNKQGLREWESADILRAVDGVSLGHGWFAPEMDGETPYRHLDSGAIVHLPQTPHAAELVLHLEPSMGAAGPVSLRVLHGDGTAAAECMVLRRQELRVPLEPNTAPSQLTVGFEAPRASHHQMRALVLRAWQVSLDAPAAPASSASLADRVAQELRERVPVVHGVLAPAYRKLRGMSDAAPVEVPVESNAEPEFVFPAAAPSGWREPIYLHTNACGDFTLMHRDHWLDVRGYAEFDAYSMNIDSILCWAAHYAGYREEILREPLRVYHVEHGRGSGWTPEGRDLLYSRIKEAGLPWIEYADLMSWARSMYERNCPIIFNKSNWGLAGDELRETGPDRDAPAELRWCKDDPASPSRRKTRAGVGHE
jgi:hypothetical protein